MVTTVILKILSILGIVLLVILGVLLFLLLIVLFVPIFYRVKAERKPLAEKQQKDGEGDDKTKDVSHGIRIYGKASWLFGLLRVICLYPLPGDVRVKILFFTVYKKAVVVKTEEEEPKEGGRTEEKTSNKGTGKKGSKKERSKDRGSEEKGSERQEAAREGEARKETAIAEEDATSGETSGTPKIDKPEQGAGNDTAGEYSGGDKAEKKRKKRSGKGGTGDSGQNENPKQNFWEKIQYTFRDKCDKIKNTTDRINDLRENASYYKETLLCDDTKGLVNHVFRRLGKILKSIRPRKLRADILFGTGSPDTTGYLFGVYGILCTYLGKHVLLTPDFERKILEGEVYAAGYITVFRILWQVLRVVLDKRLWQLKSRLERGKE